MLTRRRDKNHDLEHWTIRFGDIDVGHISLRAGVPRAAPQWGWACGFYPGTEPGQHRYGAAATFDDARAAFAQAWQRLAATRTEADYRAWRDSRDRTAWKYRMHDLHLPLPTQRPDGVARCFCGEVITSATMDNHVLGAHRGDVRWRSRP
ncbi:hypothetical protein [Bradyrhizobium sp. Ai1a-2]|uniref:hypothetical protein n=1 Tax=Bradyrhizobium sp. Ai1a-2 TaxID=196490 RepID=UPI000429D477|nr:hypothetical protein [Bradyrhizobium sp. Ai1a-2]